MIIEDLGFLVFGCLELDSFLIFKFLVKFQTQKQELRFLVIKTWLEFWKRPKVDTTNNENSR